MNRAQLLSSFLPGVGKPIRLSRREILTACRVRGPVVISGENGTGRSHAAMALHSLAGGKAEAVFTLDWRRNEDRLLPETNGSSPVLFHVRNCTPSESNRALLGCLLKELPAGSRLAVSLSTPPSDDWSSPSRNGFFDEQASVIHLAPLRSRREDIPWILADLVRRQQGGPLNLTADDLDYLQRHSWPGNITELAEWARIRLPVAGDDDGEAGGRGNVTLARLLDQEIDRWVSSLAGSHTRGDGLLRKVVERIEKRAIRSVLTLTAGNQVESAEILGINRNTLAGKIKRYGLSARRRRS